MLGVLFRVGQQLFLQSRVFVTVAAARPRTCDRPHLRMTAREFHERFGRGADDYAVAKIAIEHVGRGIQQSQRAIRFERLELAFARETHRKHQLIDVAGCDVLLRAMDSLDELGLAEAAHGRRVADALFTLGNRAAQRLHDLLAQRAALAFASGMQQRDAAREVIEDQQRLRCEIVGLRRRLDDSRTCRQALEIAHEIVAGNTDEPAGQRHAGNSWAGLRRARERFAQCMQQFLLRARRGARAAVHGEAALV